MTNVNLTFLGYIIILGFLYLMSKTRAGYNIIFYGLLLVAVLLLVGQHKAITKIMVKD